MRDDAEDDGEDAADEDGEEIVDARAAAPQPVQALDLERERHQHADERQHVDVLAERREALRDGNQFGDQPLSNRSRYASVNAAAPRRQVRDDVIRDEQPVEPAHHDGRPAVRLLMA